MLSAQLKILNYNVNHKKFNFPNAIYFNNLQLT